MRRIRRLDIPFERAFIARQVLGVAPVTPQSTVGESDSCNFVPCEDGLLNCGTCEDDFERSESGQWGTGGLGLWVQPDGGTFSVSGGAGVQTSLVSQHSYVLWPFDGFDNEILFQLELDDSDNTWAFDIGLSAGSFPTSDASTFTLFGFSTVTGITSQDDRPGSNVDFNDVTISPSIRNRVVWVRMLTDDRGIYIRIWDFGDTEPVNTAPLTPPVGGRGEKWHAYRVSVDSAVTPIAFDRLVINGATGESLSIFNVQIITPCVAGGCTIYFQDGNQADSSEVGNVSIIAKCTLSGSTGYLLPSAASKVSDVYIDYMPTDAWTFVPENNSIIFPTSLSQDTFVHARYLFLEP